MDFNAEGPTRTFDYNTGTTKGEGEKSKSGSRDITLAGMAALSDSTGSGGGGGNGGGGDGGGGNDGGAATIHTGNDDDDGGGGRKRRKRDEKYNSSSNVFKSDASFSKGSLWNEKGKQLVTDDELKKLKVYRMSEVNQHNTDHDAWIVINNVIYDISTYLPTHPGGAALITGLCGRDGTQAFYRSHSNIVKAEEVLKKSPLCKRVGRIFALEHGGGGSNSGSVRGSFSDVGSIASMATGGGGATPGGSNTGGGTDGKKSRSSRRDRDGDRKSSRKSRRRGSGSD